MAAGLRPLQVRCDRCRWQTRISTEPDHSSVKGWLLRRVATAPIDGVWPGLCPHCAPKPAS